ncbi:MAG TPA: alkaline phosphatase family protein [Balneolales bacterium]|nr:alkaline phosphatase family protein [Balneolales bacterium]
MMGIKSFKYLLALLLGFFTLNSYAQKIQADHVVVVIYENHGFNQIIGSPNAPYINSLVKKDHSALFTNSHGVTHPSQPNYVMLFSGSNHGITDDKMPHRIPFNAPNLGSELLAKGLTFAGYSEDLPSIGFNGANSGDYARKHNPWVNWQGASKNAIPAKLNLPLSKFPDDYSKLPTVSFVIPNQHHDMHNGKDPARIQRGDQWLKNHLGGYIRWAKKHNSLLILTFDEDNFTPANHIPTLFVGQMVKKGKYDEHINHFNILRTIEDMYGLPHAGSSADVTPITNCWSHSMNHK